MAETYEDRLDVSAVRSEDAAAVWEDQWSMIEKGLGKGQGDGTSPAELLLDIQQEESQMWAVHDGGDIYAVVVISLIQFTRSKKLMVHLIAGRELPLWTDKVQMLLLELKDESGADCIEASCRPGLAKFLAAKGWGKKAVIMELI